MRAPLRTALFATTVLLVAVPVMADAPNGSDPNRDAQYSPFLRDTDKITDTFTLLVWDRFAQRTPVQYLAAPSTCPSTFRLPTVKELLTIVDEDPHDTYEFGATVQKAIDREAFGKYTSVDRPYWTSTPTGNAGERWGVSFKDGTMIALKEGDTTGYYARCVK